MALTAPIYSEFDERSAAEAMARAERVVSEGARDMSRVFSNQMSDGMREGSRALDRFAQDAQSAYRRAGEAAEELERRERSLQDLRDRGASNTDIRVQSERVAQARRDEARATREAAAAIDDYESRASGAGSSFMDGLRDSMSGAQQAGGDMADNIVSGFAGSSALRLLGPAISNPVMAAVAAVGLIGGKVLADNIAAGLQSLQVEDLFQARLGVSDGTMAQYGEQAAKAYTDMWGASVADNLRAVQFGVQGGVISADASDAEINQTITHLQTLAQVMEVDVQEAARAAGQLMRGGFAADGEQAADIIASGFQNGLDIAGDWLDTITEYSTQFRKLGIDGGEAIGLISQGLQGGARDSDKVADSLKEFSIRAVDGSELTAKGFAALGFRADEMAQRFLAGGDSARTAFGVTLEALRSLDDPIQQALTWQALFGTQWEDMGDAINNMDLSKAREEFGNTEGSIDSMTGKLSEHTNGWDGLGRQIDTTFGKLQKWLADSAIGKFLNQGLPDFLSNTVFDPPPKPGDADYPSFYPPLDPQSTGPRLPSPVPGPSGQPVPQNIFDRARADLEARGVPLPALLGDPAAPPPPPEKSAAETYKEWYQSGPPAGAPGAPGAPVPGDRTPMLTDTQQKAADEAEKAAKGGGSLPPAPVLPLQYTSTAGLPAQIASATTRVDEARHAVAEKEARVNQLMQSNVADADAIQKARNDLTKAEQNEQQAEVALHDSRVKATEQQTKQISGMASNLNELGAKLDADFGMSKGLGGIVENFVKAAGNILAAPFLQALGLISAANPNEGSGLVGILAANGAFGSQYTPGAIAAMSQSGIATGSASYSGYSAGSGVPYAGVPIGSNLDVTDQSGLGLLRALGLEGNTYGGHTTDGAATDREVDVTDPVGGFGSAKMTAFARYARQNPHLFEEFIYNDPSTGEKTGIRSGQLVGPGTSQPGYYADNWGGHQDHAHIEPAKGGGLGGGADQASGALTSLAGAAQQASGALAGGAWNADWNAIAQAESGGNWGTNTGNGYFGGLQFAQSSWDSAGGQQYAPRADLATPYQQALTAENLLATQGPGAWPNTFVPGSSGPPAPAPVVGGGGTGMSGIFPVMAGPPAAAGLANLGLPGAGGPGVGGAVQSGMASQGMGATGGGGAQGLSGTVMGALGAATAGLDMMAPGAGAAAQIGLQLANRGIAQAGKAGGIAVSGVLETLSLSKSALANPANNWIGKFATGVSGAGMAVPNMAGKMASPVQQPGQGGPGGQGAGQGGPSIGTQIDKLEYNNHQATEDRAGADLTTNLMAMHASPGH